MLHSSSGMYLYSIRIGSDEFSFQHAVSNSGIGSFSSGTISSLKTMFTAQLTFRQMETEHLTLLAARSSVSIYQPERYYGKKCVIKRWERTSYHFPQMIKR
jgi:hypothetical protein